MDLVLPDDRCTHLDNVHTDLAVAMERIQQLEVAVRLTRPLL
jgi:hypothetical protein